MSGTGGFSQALTRAELEQALVRQIGHLRRSQAAYDSGIWEEAERLAATAYILLCDGKRKTKSLLNQLGHRDCMQFPSTTSSSMVYWWLPLCQVAVVEGRARYFPVYDGAGVPGYGTQMLSFEDWWGGIIYTMDEAKLTREQLVRSLRSQDGGAHVDSELTDEAYHLAKSMGSDRIRIVNGKPVTTAMASRGALSDAELSEKLAGPPYRLNPAIEGAHWAAMRQVSWELDQALQAEGY